MDRVLKYNLNIDRFEKPSAFEVNLDEDEPPKQATESSINLDANSNEGENKQEEEVKTDL